MTAKLTQTAKTFYFENWQGVKQKKLKRGFSTKNVGWGGGVGVFHSSPASTPHHHFSCFLLN